MDREQGTPSLGLDAGVMPPSSHCQGHEMARQGLSPVGLVWMRLNMQRRKEKGADPAEKLFHARTRGSSEALCRLQRQVTCVAWDEVLRSERRRRTTDTQAGNWPPCTVLSAQDAALAAEKQTEGTQGTLVTRQTTACPGRGRHKRSTEPPAFKCPVLLASRAFGRTLRAIC